MTEELVTNDDLCALVLPWCKAEHPDHYQKTLKVAVNPIAFRKYLLRLVELRAEEDKHWRNRECPIKVLDETSLSIQVRRKETGEMWEFKGKKGKLPIDNRINELACDKYTFDTLQFMKQTLDLTYVP